MSSATEVISRWSTLFEGFQMSPQDFYTQVTKAVEKRRMPNAKIERIQMKEGNFFFR